MFYKLIISYDGTSYFGWQKTNAGPSVQEAIQKALKQAVQEEPLPEAASRTDKGVHAVGQVVSFAVRKSIDPKNLWRALNAYLPPDIRILKLESLLSCFYPSLEATGKEYHYHLSLNDVQDPMNRHYSWHLRYPLDLQIMKKESELLLGRHDFSAFANIQKYEKENPFCTVHRIEFLTSEENQLKIVVAADRFLYKMARNIVGTLVYAGCGKLSQNCMATILDSKNRTLAGMTAPAHGLTLYRVFYERINCSYD